MKARNLVVLRELLSRPVAPFHEDAVIAAVWRWAGKHSVDFSRDESGNILLQHRAGLKGSPHWVFAAHMDHPGFVTTGAKGRTVAAYFMGGVKSEYFPGSRVRLFAPGGEATATVISARKSGKLPWLVCRLRLSSRKAVPAGTVGMWDLPAVEVRGERLASRACDDLVGAAAVLRAMEIIVSRRIKANVTGLLTRAEEAGFVGALACCRRGGLPKDALVVAIESSASQPQAMLGDGVIVRVGDRSRTFDPSLTAAVATTAAELGRRDRAFKHVRRLMPGGTCESTVYCAWGYHATGLCVPMDNYHNMGQRGRIAAERIDLRDFACLVKLLAALPARGIGPRQADAQLKRRLEAIYRQRGKLL